MSDTPNLFIVNHPLVQHKLSIMRDIGTSTGSFRRLLREIALLMGYEVTRDLPVEMREIQTPMTSMQAPFIAGRRNIWSNYLPRRAGCLFWWTRCWRRETPPSMPLMF